MRSVFPSFPAANPDQSQRMVSSTNKSVKDDLFYNLNSCLGLGVKVLASFVEF